MRAIVLARYADIEERPLELVDFRRPEAKGNEVLLKVLACGACHTELDYAEYLWHEREIKSVANVTAQDAREFLPLAARLPIKCHVEEFELPQANDVLIDLKKGSINGAAVLRIPH